MTLNNPAFRNPNAPGVDDRPKRRDETKELHPIPAKGGTGLGTASIAGGISPRGRVLPFDESMAAGGQAGGSIAAEEVLAQLRVLFASAEFLGSRRSREFLKFAVEQTLQGQPDIVKERTLGIELFGLPADADLASNTIVRVTARDVRRRLRKFNESPAGKSAPVRIDLAPGSYVPAFTRQNCPDGSIPDSAARPLRRSDSPFPEHLLWAIAGAASGALLTYLLRRR